MKSESRPQLTDGQLVWVKTPGSCSGGTIANCLHSTLQWPNGERHPEKEPTSSPSHRSTVFSRLRWGTQARIHHHTEPVVTADANNGKSVCRSVWFSARYPATGCSWWMCSTNNGLHPFWAHRQNTRKTYPLKTKTLPFIAKVQVPWLYDKDPSFQLGGCVRFCFEHGLTSVSTCYDF